MSVREDQHVAGCPANLGDHAIHPTADVRGAFAIGPTIAPERPPGALFGDLP